MSDYKVTDSELTGIANAIRTKGGTSSPLVFPNGFTSAIGAIPTGGGSTLITKNITQNGTYDAEDDDADGYSSVIVNVSGGGGDTVAFVRCIYDVSGAVTATNGTYTLVSDSSGLYVFKIPVIGQWTFTHTGGQTETISVLPYTITDIYLRTKYLVATTGNILCESTLPDFDQSSSSWQNMTYVGGMPTYSSEENAVYMPAYASGIYGYYDLGNDDTPFTAYIVARLASGGMSGKRIVSAAAARNISKAVMLYGNSATFSTWGNNTNLNIDCINQYFIGVISAASGNAAGIAATADSISNYVEKTFESSGRYVTIGKTDTGSWSQSTAQSPANIYVKYFAVVDEKESESTILANISNLRRMVLAG